MRWPRCLVEAAGIEQHRCALLPHQQPQLSKAQVVADGEPEPAELSVEHAGLAALREGLRLLVGDLAGNVDVEEVQFVVGILELSVRVDDEGSVEELSFGPARDAADGVHLVLAALLLDGAQGGRVLEVLGELVHVLLDVGRVADLAQHRHVRPVLARSRQRLADVPDVRRLVRHATRLQDRQLELLHCKL